MPERIPDDPRMPSRSLQESWGALVAIEAAAALFGRGLCTGGKRGRAMIPILIMIALGVGGMLSPFLLAASQVNKRTLGKEGGQ
jgi:hypothetical protein